MQRIGAVVGKSKAKKISYSILTILLTGLLVGMLFPTSTAQGDPTGASSRPGVNSREVARAEKSVEYDGGLIAPDEDVSLNDHLYSYTLTASAYQTLRVEYWFQDPIQGSLGMDIPMGEKIFENLPFGYTFERGSGESFDVLLPPNAQELSDATRYQGYEVVSFSALYARSGWGVFDQDTTIHEDITLTYVYGPAAPSDTVDLEGYLQIETEEDGFGHNSRQSLIDQSAELYVDLYRSTSPFDEGELVEGASIVLSDWEGLSLGYLPLAFYDQERRDSDNKPYYYQTRFRGKNLPACYPLPSNSPWTSANFHDPQYPDDPIMMEGSVFFPTMQELTLEILDTNTGQRITELPYEYPFSSQTLYVLTGATISESNKIPAPVYDSVWDSPQMQGVRGEPAEGFYTDIPIMEDAKVTFTVKPEGYDDRVYLSGRSWFENFVSEGLEQDAHDAIEDQRVLFTATPILDGVPLPDKSVLQEAEVDYGYAYYYFDELPRCDPDTKKPYTYQVSQELVGGIPELNGQPIYEMDAVSEEFAPIGNPSDTAWGYITFENSVRTYIIRIDFSEQTAEGTRALLASEIPQDFMHRFAGWASSSGSILIRSLKGANVSIIAPEIYGKEAIGGSPFTNGGNPVTSNTNAEFVYDFTEETTTDLNVSINWGTDTSYWHDDFGNLNEENILMDETKFNVELYQRLVGSDNPGTKIRSDVLDLTGETSLPYWSNMRFTGLSRSDESGNLYEYQVRLTETSPGSVPQRNGIPAFSLSESAWVTVENYDQYDEAILAQVDNPSISYNVMTKYLNGDDNSTTDVVSQKLYAGYSEEIFWGHALGAGDLGDFNTLYRTNFSTVSPEISQIETIDQDIILEYEFTEGVAALSEPSVSKMPELPLFNGSDAVRENKDNESTSAQDASPEDQAREEKASEEEAAKKEAAKNLDSIEQIDTVNTGATSSPQATSEQDATSKQAAYSDQNVTKTQAATNSLSEGGGSCYSEEFALYLVGNENVFNIAEVDPGVFTFQMTNGGVFELYAERPIDSRMSPTQRFSSGVGKEYAYTLTENSQHYGAHSVRLDYGHVMTEVGEDVPVSASFNSLGNFGSIPAHAIAFGSNLYPTADLRVLKHETDNEGTLLSGVTFDLLKKEGSNYVPFRQGLTTINGLILLDDVLTAGDYQLIETQTIDGYVLKTEPTTFTITSADTALNASPVEVKIANDKALNPGTDPTSGESGDPSKSNDPTTSPKTGDSLAMVVGILVVIALAAGALAYTRRSSNKPREQ